MFVQRVVFKGAPGQLVALREGVCGTIRPGEQTVLGVRLWGDGPYFSLTRGFETLDALEKVRDAWKPDPAFAARLPELLSVPPINELWELPELSALPVGSAMGRYTTRWSFVPAQGKGPELLAAIRELAQRLSAAGNPHGLWLRVSGGPPTVGMVGNFANLAAIEKARAAALADQRVREFGQKLTPLLGQPVATPDVYELLVRPQ